MHQHEQTQRSHNLISVQSVHPTNPQACALLARPSPRQLRELDRYLQPLIPQNIPIGNRPRHQDQCTAGVTFKTARTRRSHPDR
jgi:hypothetical protein